MGNDRVDLQSDRYRIGLALYLILVCFPERNSESSLVTRALTGDFCCAQIPKLVKKGFLPIQEWVRGKGHTPNRKWFGLPDDFFLL